MSDTSEESRRHLVSVLRLIRKSLDEFSREDDSPHVGVPPNLDLAKMAAPHLQTLRLSPAALHIYKTIEFIGLEWVGLGLARLARGSSPEEKATLATTFGPFPSSPDDDDDFREWMGLQKDVLKGHSQTLRDYVGTLLNDLEITGASEYRDPREESDPISLRQAACLVHVKPKTLYNRKAKYPAPEQFADNVWLYRDLRPWLLKHWPKAASRLPQKYSEAKQLFSVDD